MLWILPQRRSTRNFERLGISDSISDLIQSEILVSTYVSRPQVFPKTLGVLNLLDFVRCE